MNIEKNIQRLSWRFSNGKAFKPNQNDIDSLNFIIDWVNRQRSETINNNILYAKLYMYVFADLVRKYESNFLDDLMQKELHRIIDTDLNVFYERITSLINDHAQFEFLRSKGFSLKHPMQISKEQKDKERLIIKNLTEEDIQKIKDNHIEKEDVISNLNLMITESLNRFSHEAVI